MVDDSLADGRDSRLELSKRRSRLASDDVGKRPGAVLNKLEGFILDAFEQQLRHDLYGACIDD